MGEDTVEPMANQTIMTAKPGDSQGMLEPDVSVVIPVHNRPELLVRAVRSCLSEQEKVSVEVVVVDDESDAPLLATLRECFPGVVNDGTERRAKSGNYIIYARQTKAGASTARNYGLGIATGHYVKFLDSDDELLPNTLHLEVAKAKETNAHAVVSGWEEREFGSVDADVPSMSREVPPPIMQDGIDDLLLGRAAWTAAALYQRDFIKDLRWDPRHGKADDWGWFCTVCLAGAQFACLHQATAVYNQRPVVRITNQGDPFLDSTEVRQRILRWIEDELRCRGSLTRDRCERLIQYYYKDAKVLCERGWRRWWVVWQHCRGLSPGFRPSELDPAVRPFVDACGPFWGVLVFVNCRRLARLLGIRRTR
jgi:glycosyltransferase involved in cell wall biosynthesis